jgi:hypothetical protein
MSAHILHGPEITYTNPCGLCLSPAPMCEIFLTKSTGHNPVDVIDLRKSHCKYLKKKKFNLRTAAKVTNHKPSSNVPVQCSLCPSKGKSRAPAVWKFNLERHFREVHRDVDQSEYEGMWAITDREQSLLKHKWETRLTKPKRRSKKKEGIRELQISEAHSSRMAFRSVNNFVLGK